jgi:hypothetical protein
MTADVAIATPRWSSTRTLLKPALVCVLTRLTAAYDIWSWLTKEHFDRIVFFCYLIIITEISAVNLFFAHPSPSRFYDNMGKGSKKGGKATKGKEMDWEAEGASIPGEGSAVLSAKEKQVMHAFLYYAYA